MANPLITVCPGCGRRYRITQAQLGKLHQCRHCGTQFQASTPDGGSSDQGPLTLKPLTSVQRTGTATGTKPSSTKSATTGGGGSIKGTFNSSALGTAATGSISGRHALPSDEAKVPPEWQAGDTILELYQVVSVLGTGAMGKVYRIRHLGWNMDLAVKSPRPDVLSKNGVENFEREAEVWVNLGLHPHIVTCFYVRRLGGIPRIFAEYLEGGSLENWIRQKRLQDPLQILDIAIQFAWGLHHAHLEGLIHQDVKPDNVMMTQDGMAKVTDFGLARARAIGIMNRTEMSQPDSTIGTTQQTMLATLGGMTPAYCSPEQAQGVQLAKAGVPRERRPKLTRKTDIWSWAVSILEIFTGGVVWDRGDQGDRALRDYLANPHPHPRLPGMPSALASLLAECLQPDPADRPKDMQEIASRLIGIYEAIAEHPYLRRVPRPDRALANSLNNRAVSLLDLGKRKEAQRLWEEALRVDPQHLESTYNRGLVLWRAGRLNDVDLVDSLAQKLREGQASQAGDWLPSYLLGQVHLERLDANAVLQLMDPLVASPLKEMPASDLGGKGELAPPLPPPDPGVETNPLIRMTVDLAHQLKPQSRQHIRSFTGHSGSVLCVGIHPPYLVSGGEDNAVKLWDLESGRCLRTLLGHSDLVWRVLVNPNQRQVLSGCRDGSIKVWDLDSGKCLRTLSEHRNGIHTLELSPDGKQLLSGSYDNELRLWDLTSGKCLKTLSGHCWSAAAWSGDGQFILSGGYQSLRIWELETGAVLNTLALPRSVFQISLDQAAQYSLLSYGHPSINSEIGTDPELWQIVRGKRYRKFSGHRQGVNAVWLSPDHRFALSASRDGTLKVWEVNSGRCLTTLKAQPEGVNCLALDPSQEWLVCGGSDASIMLWHMHWEPSPISAPLMLSRIQGSAAALETELAYETGLQTAAEALLRQDFSQAIEHLQFARSQPGCLRRSEVMAAWGQLYLWLPRVGLQDGWEGLAQKGHSGSITAIAFSPNSQQVVTASEDKTLNCWDPLTGKCLQTLAGHSAYVTTVAFSGDGRWIVSGSEDNTLKLWDPVNGQCLRTFLGHSAYVTAVGLTHSGDYVLSGSYHDQTLRLWDVVTGRCLRTFSERIGITSLSLSRDNRYLLVSGYETIQLWDVVTGECLRRLSGVKDVIRSVSLSPDGRYALAGSYDSTVTLWDLTQDRCVQTLTGHQGWVTGVQFSGDGRYAVSGSRDKTVRLWDLSNGSCLHTFEGHSGAVNGICLSPDHRFLVSGGRDKTLRVGWLDWSLEVPSTREWVAGAQPHLESFLALHRPFAKPLPKDHLPTEAELQHALIRAGDPVWTEADRDELQYQLGCAGYGWIPPEVVEAQLQSLAGKTILS